MSRYVSGLMRFECDNGSMSPLRFNIVWSEGTLEERLIELAREATKDEGVHLKGHTVTELVVVDNELPEPPSPTLLLVDELTHIRQEIIQLEDMLNERGHMLTSREREDIVSARTMLGRIYNVRAKRLVSELSW